MSYTPTLPRRLATKAMIVAVPAVLGCAVQISYLGESAFPFGLSTQAKKDISPLAAAVNCGLGWIGLIASMVSIGCALYCAYRTKEIDFAD
jgi:hypothetical protein